MTEVGLRPSSHYDEVGMARPCDLGKTLGCAGAGCHDRFGRVDDAIDHRGSSFV